MKKLKSVGQFLTALSLAVVLSFSTVVPAHAVDPLTVAGLVASGVQVLMQAVQMYVDAETQSDRDAAISEMMSVWRSSVYTSSTVEVSADVLQDTCMELNSSGFPCEVVWNETIRGFVIKGINYVYIPDLITSRTINIANRYFGNVQGYTFYSAAASDTSVLQSIESMLQGVNDRLNTLTNTLAMQDPLEEWLKLFHAQIEVVQLRQELVNVQLDELIEAVQGLSVVGGGDVIFDTTSITDKLDEVIGSIDDAYGHIAYYLMDIVLNTNHLPNISNQVNNLVETVSGMTGDLSDIVSNTDALPSISSQLRTLGGYVSQIADAQMVGIPAKMDELLDAINNMDIVIEDNDSVITPIVTPSCDHDFTIYNKVAASCSTPGFKRYTCKICDYSYYDLVQPLGHSWNPYYYPDEYQASGYVWQLAWSEVCYYEGEDGYYMVGPVPLEEGGYYRVEVDRFGNSAGYARMRTDFWGDPGLQLVLSFPGNGSCYLSEYEFWLRDMSGFISDLDDSEYAMEAITINVYKRVPSETVEPILELQYCDRCGSGKDFNAMLHFLNGQFKRLEYTITNVGDGISFEPLVERMDTIISLMGGSVGITGCEHTYVSEINQEQTCILPGLQTFICESCGSSYSEILESLGHDWQCTDHVENELDPETGELISSGYDIYTCSRCNDSYNDYEGSGAPASESTSLTGIVSRVFEKLGVLVGDLLSMGIRMLDKLLTGFDDLVTSFNEKTQQIVNFGSGYTAWLSGFWDVVPSDLQLAWGFCLVVVCLGIVGKKLFFTP